MPHSRIRKDIDKKDFLDTTENSLHTKVVEPEKTLSVEHG